MLSVVLYIQFTEYIYFLSSVFIFSNKESTMQKRFCSCGASIWVRYFLANTRWMAFFYTAGESSNGTRSCPHCGSDLNIHMLR